VYRKLEQHSFKTHSRQCSGVRTLTLQTEVAGLNPVAGTLFLEIIPFGHIFLLSTFETAVTQHPNHLQYGGGTQTKLNTCHLEIQLLLQFAICSLFFFKYSQSH